MNKMELLDTVLPRRYKWITAALAVTLSMPAFTAERIVLQHRSFHDVQRLVQVILPDKPQIQTQSALNTLRFMNQRVDKNRMTHIRMQQEYAGFPVMGGYAVLHRHAQNVVSMNGAIYADLQQELGQPDASFVRHSALVLKQFLAPYAMQTIREKHITPMVYIDDRQRAHWAYRVSVLLEPTSAMPSRPCAIIDATTGVELEAWNDIKTLRTSVKGMGFGGNQRIGKYQFGQNMPLLSFVRDDFSGLCYLENQQVKVVNMANDYESSNLPMSFDCPTYSQDNIYWTGAEGDGYDIQNGSYSPSNDALYIGGVIKQMFHDDYGVEALMDHYKPMQLVMRVHYGKRFSNAFWDGRQMTFGDGDRALYSLVSLGIGAHEISHGFTENHSDLVYFGQSGGINESFSDMAAQAVEYYAKGQSSWLIGAEILKHEAPYAALRYMDKPSRDGRSIDKATQYRKGIDVHYASGVYNRLFYLLANSPGWDPRKAFHVMVKANMDYWTPNTTFEEGACGILNAATDLDLPADEIKRSLDDVMIDYEGC